MTTNNVGQRVRCRSFRHIFIGYARVSTPEQNADHQVDALRRSGVDERHIYLETASGAKASRPQLDLVMQLLRDGDTLKVKRLDRGACYREAKTDPARSFGIFVNTVFF